MKNTLSRRAFLQSSAIIATVSAASQSLPATPHQETGAPSPIQLGIATYTFRNFTRALMIGYLKLINISDINAKDVQDHLPTKPVDEAFALADYSVAGIKLHAAGAINFPTADDDDIRSKFDYCKRAGISIIVASDPAPDILPLIEKFVMQYDIRFAIHNHGPGRSKFFPLPSTSSPPSKTWTRVWAAALTSATPYALALMS